MSDVSNRLSVGLVTGGGTGQEIAVVFRCALEHLSSIHEAPVDIVECPHRFGTFFSAIASGTAREIHRGHEHDCVLYLDFVRELARRRVPALFRTAMDAQTLYLARVRLGAVKVESFKTPDAGILVVRDCGQGFYTGSNDTQSQDVIRRTCEFRRDWTERVIDHALAIAAANFGGVECIDHVLAAYKFHLLDRRFADWVSEYGRRRGVSIGLFQPDTMNRNLLRDSYRGNVLIIGANEWVDIMHVALMNRYGTGTHETRAAHSTYLAEGVNGMMEYQTVHGSADDIAGRGVVNPQAALRAAAAIMERHGSCDGAMGRMEDSIERACQRGFNTPDQGGEHTTEEVTGAVLDVYGRRSTARVGWTRKIEAGQALLIIDMQNDMCAPGGCFDRLGLIDTSRMAELANRLETLLERVRPTGLDVLHAQTFVDVAALPANMEERIRRLGRGGYLREGDWGAAAYGPTPAATERVIVKRGYDPFLGTDLGERLKLAGAGCLVLVGVFADICIDAAARTAYQLGITPVVLTDGTLALERDLEGSLSFMERYYGARVISMEKWLADLQGPATGVGSDS